MLKHGILGLINYNAQTGYEIMTTFRHSLNYFWNAQTSQIYRELQAMEKAGWISRNHVAQSGKPDRNVYSITESGKAELIHWLREESIPRSGRSPLLLKTFFLGECSAEENIAFFERLRQLTAFPDSGLEASGYAEFYSQQIDNPERAVYWRMTIRFAQMYEQMLHAWCEQCIRDLSELKDRGVHTEYHREGEKQK